MDKKIQIHDMDIDCFVLSINTNNCIKDLQNLKDLFDFSNLSENDELLKYENDSKKTEKFLRISIEKY